MDTKLIGDIKSIRFSPKVDEKLTQLSLKLGRTKKELFAQMVDYFYRTNKDPVDLNDEMLKKEISIGIFKILSFGKQQETDLLVPLFDSILNVETSTGILQKSSDYSMKQNKDIHDVLSQMQNEIAVLRTNIHDKKHLVVKFKRILDGYISERESLTWTASSSSKEEIRQKAFDSLFNL